MMEVILAIAKWLSIQQTVQLEVVLTEYLCFPFALRMTYKHWSGRFPFLFALQGSLLSKSDKSDRCWANSTRELACGP